MTERRPITLITGASAGIGVALAHEFAAHSHELVLTARRADRLNALADEIAAAGRPRPTVLPLDLGTPGAVAAIEAELAVRGLRPQFVVNNAGFGLLGRADRLDRLEQLAMIDLNARALVDLSLAFVDDLAASGGGIMNVASVAGFLPGPGMAVYYATKGFVVSFTEALHAELKSRGIRVSALCPGPVATEFGARAGIKRSRSTPLDRTPEQVAKAGYAGLMANRRCVVPGWPNWLVTRLPRILPRGMLLWLIAQAQGKRLSASP
jgi:uncharacterized protein